jgi:putative transposase
VIEAGFALPTERVTRELDQLLEWRSIPIVIRCDNGPEFISNKFTDWAKKHGISMDYLKPGKPQQNAYIERANRKIRYDWLSKYLFKTINEVQGYVTKWLWLYKNEPPHKANGVRPPLIVA